ncbi:MAG: hypothetical protein ACREGI_02710, partial [Candidatus Levyibacteriota bacterium]
VLSSIGNHEKANDKYRELGLNLYELSQRATFIYNKATHDNKRLLINLVFSELSLKNDNITATYSKAFRILSEFVKLTNSSKVEKKQRIVAKIFEPNKKPDLTIQMPSFWLHRPILLRG